MYSYVDPIERLMRRQNALLGIHSPRAMSGVPLFNEDEYATTTDSILGTLGSSASAVMDLVDKYTGLRAIKGGINYLATGENPSEMWSAIPFSDFLYEMTGFGTNPENQVTGKQLVHNLGLIDASDNEFSDMAAGIAADILLDPTTYLTGGLAGFGKVLRPAGKVADAAGILRLATASENAVEGGVRSLTKLGRGPRELGLTTTLGQAIDKSVDVGGRNRGELLTVMQNAATKQGHSLDDLLGQTLTSPVGLDINPFRAPRMNVGEASDAALGYARFWDKAGHGAGRLFSPITSLLSPAAHGTRGIANQSMASRLTDEAVPHQEAIKGGFAHGMETQRASEVLGGLRSSGLDDEAINNVLLKSAQADISGTPMEMAKRFSDIESFDPLNLDHRKLAIAKSVRQNLIHEAEKLGVDLADENVDAAADELFRLLEPEAEMLWRERRKAIDEGFDPKMLDESERFYVPRTTLTPEGIRQSPDIVGRNQQRRSGARLLNEVDLNDLITGPVGRAVRRASQDITMAHEDPRVLAGLQGLVDEGVLTPEWLEQSQSWLTRQQAQSALRHHRKFGQWDADSLVLEELVPYGDTLIEDVMTSYRRVDADSLAAAKKQANIPVAQRTEENFDDELADMLRTERRAAVDILNYVRRQNRHIDAGAPLYDTDIQRNLLNATLSEADRALKGKHIQRHFASFARFGGEIPAEQMDQFVPLSTALEQSKLVTPRAVSRFIEMAKQHNPTLLDDATVEMALAEARRLDPTAAAEVIETTDQLPRALQEIAENVFVPKEVVDGAVALTSRKQTSKFLRDIYDKWLNVWKANHTVPFPSFHSRNALTAFIQHVSAGGRYPEFSSLNPKGWIKPYEDANRLLKGEVIEGAAEFHPSLKGLSDTEASQILREQIAALNIAPRNQMLGTERAGRFADQRDLDLASEISQTGDLRGESFLRSYGRFFKDYLPRNLDEAKFWKVRGVGGDGTTFRPVAAGEQLSESIEASPRVATFLAQLKQGKDFSVAGAVSRAAHIDYTDLTQFEKNWMKRIVPFWTFQSRMLKWQAEKIFERPGGIQRQAIRLSDALMEEEEYVPPHVLQTATSPGFYHTIDEAGNEVAKFIGFDLPWEAAFNVIQPGRTPYSTIENTASNLLGQTTPLLKSGIELGTGQQLFSGRRLEDLDPSVGRMFSNLYEMSTGEPAEPWRGGGPLFEQAVGLSGVGRYVSEIRRLADARKAGFMGSPELEGLPIERTLNMLSGVRTHDANLTKTRNIEAQKAIRERTAGIPAFGEFSTVFVPEELYPSLPPEQQAYARWLRTTRSLHHQARVQAGRLNSR